MKLFVFLLSGAIINVAVAWGIAANTNQIPVWSEERLFISAAEPPRWMLRSYSMYGYQRLVWNFHGTWPQTQNIDLENRAPVDHPRHIRPPSWSRTQWRKPPAATGIEPSEI